MAHPFADTAHQGASVTDSRLSGWIPTAGSADSDLLNELYALTPRSRDLVRNHPVASGAAQTLKDNIVGHQLRLSSQPKYRLLGKDRTWASEWGNQVEDEFATWADTSECDAARSQTLLGLTQQALNGALVNGDAFAIVHWMPRPNSKWATRLQMIEADRVSTPTYLSHNKNIRNGIEVDDFGAPVAYYVQKSHPGDRYRYFNSAQFEWERIPAFTDFGRRQVIHLFDKERAEQSRGKPLFTAVLREFKVSGDYLGSELHAAAANALIAAFIESDLDPAALTNLIGGNEKDDLSDYWQAVGKATNGKKIKSGSFLTLPIGTKVSSYNSGRPNTAFNGFMESCMRQISAGLNMPYELLMKDFSKTNYSSARAALLEAWRYFQGRRRWLQDSWLNDIYNVWFEEAVNREFIEAPDFYSDNHAYAYTRARWVFAGRGWVDQVKEEQAAKLRMEIGVSTLESECADQGLDWEDVLEQRKRERDRMEELGLLTDFVVAGSDLGVQVDDPNDNNETLKVAN
jgi:lambda family phage portal protein